MTTATPAQSNLVYVTGRISFPWIADPQQGKNDKGEVTQSYNTDVIIAPNDPNFQKFMQACMAVAQDKWKENATAAMQRINSDRKTRCYGQGEEKTSQKTFQVHPGYAGNVYISSRSTRQPQIIDVDGTQVDPANTMKLRAVASRIYGGCYANLVLKPWAQSNDKGIGIRCDLVAIQFAADGESFGAGPTDVTPFFSAVQGAVPTQFGAPAPAVAMPAAPFPMAAAPSFAPAPVAAPAAPVAFGMPGVPSFM